MIWMGYVAIVVAVLWISLKLYLAYNSAGGTIMVVVYDAVIYPPVLIAVGLYFVLPSLGVQLHYWIYIAVWAACSGVVAGAIRLSEELGDRPL